MSTMLGSLPSGCRWDKMCMFSCSPKAAVVLHICPHQSSHSADSYINNIRIIREVYSIIHTTLRKLPLPHLGCIVKFVTALMNSQKKCMIIQKCCRWRH